MFKLIKNELYELSLCIFFMAYHILKHKQVNIAYDNVEILIHF